MTLIDHAISAVAWEACARRPCVTLQLDSQYLTTVKRGQFVQARAQVTRQTPSILFMKGQLTVDGHPVLTAQAIMKVLSQTKAHDGASGTAA